MDINKIRDERLTEDEKMELIADYLEGGSTPAPVYISPYFQDYSEDGGGSTGEISDIQGRGTSYESFTDAATFGQDPDLYHPVFVIPSIELPNGNYLGGTVPAQFGTNGDGNVEVIFHIYSTAETKDRVYSLVLSQSEEEAWGGGHAINAVWTRLA